MRIELTRTAEREFCKLSPDIRQRLDRALRGLRKFRVGDHRVLLWWDTGRNALVVYAVAHRRDIYRRLR